MIAPQTLGQLVRSQYERYPYPDFDPHLDKPQLLISGHLALMSEVLWGGQKSTKGLRVLDAGCGTGGPVVAMALHFPEAEIVAVDFSETSLKKARHLAELYHCQNIKFYNISIQQLPELGKTFDFVSASGVLHHLPEPADGLQAIGQVLDPQGVVSIMLYGKYGRAGIYMVQEALKKIAAATGNPELTAERIRFAYDLVNHLPSHHPLLTRGLGREMQEGKAAGIVDLLLHANDIPFDVPAVYALCQASGLSFYRWLFPLIYSIENLLPDAQLQHLLKQQSLTQMQLESLAELAYGRNSKHSFFAVRPEFQPYVTSYKNGHWRHLHAKLTPCMAWNRTTPVPGSPTRYAIPFTIIQDAWGPLIVCRWELEFLAHILPELSLGQVLALPSVENHLPFSNHEELNRAVEELLEKTLARMALVFIDPAIVKQ